jgi:hypothetical protein
MFFLETKKKQMSYETKKKDSVIVLLNLLEKLRHTFLEHLPRNATEPDEDISYSGSDSDTSSGSSSSSSGSSSSSSSGRPEVVYPDIRQEQYLEEVSDVLTSRYFLEKSLRKIYTQKKKKLKARKNLLKLLFREIAHDIERTSANFFLDEDEESYETGKELAESILDEYISKRWLTKFFDSHYSLLNSLIEESDLDDVVPDLVSDSSMDE